MDDDQQYYNWYYGSLYEQEKRKLENVKVEIKGNSAEGGGTKQAKGFNSWEAWGGEVMGFSGFSRVLLHRHRGGR